MLGQGAFLTGGVTAGPFITLSAAPGPISVSGQGAQPIAENRVNRVLGRWQASYPHVAAHPALVTGAPHKALCEAASTEVLLVVGSRGLGPVGRTLLGFVSQSVIRHAVPRRSGPARARPGVR